MSTSPAHPDDSRTPARNRPLRSLRLATIGASILFAIGSASHAASLTPERTLRIEFVTTPPFIESNPNVLGCALGYVNIVAPYQSITASLYNGNTLLGTGTSTLGAGHAGIYSMHFMPVTWKTAASPWNPYGPPVVANFSSIHNGTIQGRIDITIQGGQIDLEYSQFYLRTIFATYSNGGSSIPPYPTITSVKLIPEWPGDPEPPPVIPPTPPVELDPEDDFTVTTAEFKAACEEAEGNAVVLLHSVKISNGGAAQEHVAAGCTLILGPNVKLEIENAAITFDGPVSLQSSHNAEVIFKQSMFAAPTVTINLTGAKAALGTQDSSLHAEGGDLLIALGDEGKLEVAGQFPGNQDALSSAGIVRIRGGRKFLSDFTGASVYAPLGFQLDLTGSEPTLKASGSSFASPEGSIAVVATSSKALMEFNNSEVRFQNTATIRCNGADGNIKLNGSGIGSFGGGTTSGGVTIEAGAGTAARGVVEISQLSLENVAAATIRASKGGSYGSLKLENSVVSATGSVLLESGTRGKTEVKDNDITSGTQIRIATGSSGSCSSGSNNLAAPIVQACP